MELFPAIDLKNGQCVRLAQGDFNAVTVYEADPLKMARKFADAGARWLHVVDLDGARDGQSRQLDIIANIAENVPLKLQTGGGIREASTIEQFIAVGAARIVIGSLAVKNRPLVEEWLRHFGPERIVLALDVKLDGKGEPEVLTHGWQSGSQQSLWELLEFYSDRGLETLLCTDVSRDGMLAGANEALYRIIQRRYPGLDVLASGGVSGLDDLLSLAGAGLAGAVIGKALYEGRIDLAEALKAVSRRDRRDAR
ncbi:MAG: 1-(5-phosphoribosyl)-5-[(5-phosphoribosylamino)methylideneamino]imidazole-4-carboxamide isomerase [Bdellovibrionales bacterium]